MHPLHRQGLREKHAQAQVCIRLQEPLLHTLPQAYNSLCEQTCFDFEWIIVDDGSVDDTAQLVESWIRQESRFPIIYLSQPNGGKHRAVAACDTGGAEQFRNQPSVCGGKCGLVRTGKPYERLDIGLQTGG